MSTQAMHAAMDTISEITSKIPVKKGMAPSLDQFATDLLSGVKWTDFEGDETVFYQKLVGRSFDFVEERPASAAKIEYYDVTYGENFEAGSKQQKNYTVIELLNDDVPFLLDSILLCLGERSINIHHVLHPVLTVRRDKNGKLKEVLKPMAQGGEGVTTESFISLHVDQLDEVKQKALAATLSDLVGRVKLVVNDWLVMRNRLTTTASILASDMPQVPVHQLSESIHFLRWLLDNNFTFLGMREYRLSGKGKTVKLAPKRGTGLGLLRDPEMKVLRRGKDLAHMTPEVRKFFFSPDPIIVTKANIKSDIHRRAHMDYIGVKLYDDKGRLKGELRIVGLFTSSAYASKVASVPLLRQKLDHVLDSSGLSRESHSGKALTNIIETYPRDELFQISNDLLTIFARDIETLDHAPRVKVLKRVDEFDRFASVMVFLPRDQFSTDSRKAVGAYLANAFKGRVSAHYPYFTEAPYVRIHYIIGRDEGKTPAVNADRLEKSIAQICRRWDDRMQEALKPHYKPTETEALIARYGAAFPAGYQESYGITRLLDDVQMFERLGSETGSMVSFHADPKGGRDSLEVALYNLDEPIPLSERVPILENLGFSVINERSYEIRPRGGEGERLISLHMMKLKTANGQAVDLQKLDDALVAGFRAVSIGAAENDRLNQLISLLGADWRDVVMMRSLSRYLRQINVPYDQDYIADVLVRYGAATQLLIDLFHARFDPLAQKGADARVKRLSGKIDEALAEIPSLDEDQILRSFRNLMMAALRTNFYQVGDDGTGPESLAFKLDSQAIEGAPEPRPYREIFVYSPKVEGVHLRFGKIARGGLRWSDRHQDFRTEVLGLVKAQLVKNSVIVPTGSKGGFVPKDMPENPDRETFMAVGVAAYKRFITALLSVTDNRRGKVIVPPRQTVRYDEDDPYLVVAADKGTATFSDIANEISVNRGFWLGDAFASGGSQGYDHKVMGITARGGWEAVKRHFREMDVNIQRQAFTAIGVGDMSGDVFGNGMLLSKATRLQAAFDHRDIFIDPDPDPKQGWRERKRLFDLGRSSWQDYDRKLISKGGGVFSRSLKSIPLSDEMRAMLCVEAEVMSPAALMKAILKMQADLLWFGGIGTYVKGGQEANADVGDRANDAIRVSAHELNVKVIGEGANLGITQAGRMEFAAKGGRVNTDAIDNSAGVNSSDLEVNIKIALGQAVEAGKLSYDERNKVLVSMTEDVAKRCLVNNYRQTLALSLGELRGVSDLGFQQRLIRHLETSGLLSREIEGLPDDATLKERREAGEALGRPELSTLLGFAKIDLFNDLVETEIVEDKFFASALSDYFPDAMQKPFAAAIRTHPLRREIVATQLTNDIINRGGSTMALRLREETGCSYGEIAAAYTAASAVFGLEQIYAEVDALDNGLKGAVQLALYARLQSAVRRQTAWFLANGQFARGLKSEIQSYKKGLAVYQRAAKKSLPKARQARAEREIAALGKDGVPKALARRIVELGQLASGLDVVLTARRGGAPVARLAEIDHAVDERLRLDALSRTTELIPEGDVYDRWALNALVNRIQAARRGLMGQIEADGRGVEAWLVGHEGVIRRVEAGIEEILSSGEVSLSKLIVAVGQVDVLASA